MNKDYFQMNQQERDAFYDGCIDRIMDLFGKDGDLPDDIFFQLDKLKQYLFSFASDANKKTFVNLSLQYIIGKGKLAYQLIETLSVIYKILDNELQCAIFNVVYPVCFELLVENRGITTVSIFIKNTHKVYTKEQQQKCEILLEKLEEVCTTEFLRDTYSYTYKNYNKIFLPTEGTKVLLLIAEFQTATSFLQPPLCLLSVLTRLKEMKIKVDFLDNRVYSYSKEQISEIAKQYNIIAITSSPLDQVQTYFLDHRHTIFCQLVNAVKDSSPSATMIVCGAHGSIKPEFVFQSTKADIILKGEYELQLPELIATILEHKDIRDISNLIIKGNETLFYTIEDYNLQHPNQWEDMVIDYSIINVEDYYGYQYIGNTHLKKMNWSVAQATRGCPYKCIFCYNFYTSRVRYKKIANLIAELKQMELLNVKEIFFLDQTFTVNRQYVRDLCNAIVNSDIHLQWTCETRIDLIDADTLKCMKAAGCIGIWFGVESFDSQVLKKNKKGYSDLSYIKTIKLLEESDIDYRAFIMLGMVGDNYYSLKNTVDEIIKNRIHISKTIVKCKERFGTELFDKFVPEAEKKSFYCFEQLGLRSGGLADTISDEDYNQQITRLMMLNKS